jgi:hypothetical protein
MSNELLASKVIIVEEDPKFSTLPAIPTAVLGGVGVTEMGPFERTITQDWDEWIEIFGGLIAESDMAVAAMGYFLNGGQTLWTKRTCHYTPNPTDEANRDSAMAEVTLTTTGAATQGSADSANSETFELAAGDTLVIENDTDAATPNTVTFDADAATITAAGGSTYPTGWVATKTMLATIDNGTEQQVDFPASSLTLAQVIDYINPQLAGAYAWDDGGELAITSDVLGTDSRVEIGAGTGNAELGFTGAEDDSGGGDVGNIKAVTAAEAETVIEADTTCLVSVSGGVLTVATPTVGAAGWVEFITAGSTAHTSGKFDFTAVMDTKQYGSAAGPGNMGKIYAKYEGAYGNALKAVVAAASSGDSDEFNLSVTENDVVREAFPNLSTVLTSARYWETYINSAVTGSKLVTAEDLLAGTPPDNQPDIGSFTLIGGDDGLVGLADADFIGDSAGGTGLYGLDQVDTMTLLVVPGRGTAAVHQAMLAYCETWREGQVFAILDPPANQSASEIVTYVKTTAAIKNFSEFGAIYWPRIRILNPNTAEYTSDADGFVTVPPSGHIAGVYARTDGARPGGLYDPPAGVERGEIIGCLGFETDEVLEERKRDLVYPELINPLTAIDGSPRHIDGTRTLLETGNFPTIAERRGVSNIERVIKSGLLFAKHTNNTRALRRRCWNTVWLYLKSQMELGAFASRDPATAFSVNFSDKLNPPSVVRAGKLLGRIGLATNKPADWIILYFSQDTRALDAEIAELAQGR